MASKTGAARARALTHQEAHSAFVVARRAEEESWQALRDFTDDLGVRDGDEWREIMDSEVRTLREIAQGIVDAAINMQVITAAAKFGERSTS